MCFLVDLPFRKETRTQEAAETRTMRRIYVFVEYWYSFDNRSYPVPTFITSYHKDESFGRAYPVPTCFNASSCYRYVCIIVHGHPAVSLSAGSHLLLL